MAASAENFIVHLQKDTAFADGFLALLVVGSLYLPSSVCGIMIIVAAFYVMADFQKREKVFNSPYFKLLFGFLTLSFFVAACYKNYSGMVMTLMLMGMLVYGMYLRTVMVRPLFDKMLDLACMMSVPAVLVAIFQKAATFASNPSFRPVSFFEKANYFGMMVEFTFS
ncbi:MAG: hypothetical protein PHU79_05660, partial [Oscillospiraceae bacterium]|nr:hypothetical protein [Oscillospiraceae bacterium]